ncbi:JAB domain-containing protein [Turicibacter sanguinis]|nr:JAB domain-containing protein [Turicibacter sanguinis]MDB8556634.1 JAB domain-containing protein [Turicibacter sanguinis]
MACLNTKNEPTNISVVSVGSLNKAIVHRRKVFKTAILSLSCQFKSDHYLSQTKQLEGVSLIQLLFS